MPLGTPVKIHVYRKEGAYLKTISRCLREFTEIGYTVIYNGKRYPVQEANVEENGESIKKRSILV